MLFGDRDDFAIEAEVESDLAPPSAVWGHMCVWCRGNSLGNFDDPYCALYPAYQPFIWLSNHLDEIWDESLSGLDDLSALNYLDGLLWGYHGDVPIEDGRTLREMRVDSARFCQFIFLSNWGEQFDRYKSFILCPSNRPVRILSRHLTVSPGYSVEVSRKGVREASRAFAIWFDEQAERLR